MRPLFYFLIAAVLCAYARASERNAREPSAAPSLQSVIFGKDRVDFMDYPAPDLAAPAVVLIHGGQCTAEDWAAVAPRLAGGQHGDDALQAAFATRGQHVENARITAHRRPVPSLPRTIDSSRADPDR